MPPASFGTAAICCKKSTRTADIPIYTDPSSYEPHAWATSAHPTLLKNVWMFFQLAFGGRRLPESRVRALHTHPTTRATLAACECATRGQRVPTLPYSNAAKVVAGVGIGYLIYRGIRLLPSLLLPLWWTLPYNAVTP